MQRVVSINLNGNAYQIEENGYNALFAYIDAVESALKDSPDRAPKLADLERALAEKCQACLAPHKTVVTSAEIDRILLELAPPPPSQPASEPAASPSNASSSGTTSPNQTSPNPWSHHRLFQIREGAMISGVCVGLSEYMHIDVTIIRILFVIFALASSGWGILVYGALMFLLPRVNTRAEASGTAATATTPPHRWPWDDGWPWDKHGWPWDTHGWPWDQPREQRREQRQERREERHHGTLTMILFLMFGFLWLSFWTRGHFFFGWPFFWGFPHWIGIIFFFMMLRLIFMPFRASRWYGYGPYGPYHPQHAWISMWNGLAWFMIMIFGVWALYHYVPEVHDFFREFQTSFRDDFHV